MKTILTLILAMASTAFAFAQNQITGKVKESSNDKMIPYATVSLLSSDSTVVTGCISNSDGVFTLKNIKSGKYILNASFLGYDKRSFELDVQQNSVDVGTVELTESLYKLEDVVVTGNRPFVSQQSDRYVVNVGSHIQTGGRNALEVLTNTPGVLVDPNGKISVMGSGVDVYIDGRPSRLSGDALKAMLTSTQGETIDRIEVITNPSARYDASGGSIVNIRTKRGAQDGFTGSIDLGYRQGRKDRENVGVSLNYRTRNLSLYGNYSADRTVGWTQVDQTNRIMMSDGQFHTFNQSATSNGEEGKIAQQYKVGADYSINPKNVIGILYTGYNTSDALVRTLSRTSIAPTFEGISSSTANNYRANPNDGNQINLNYMGQYAKPGQQLTVDVDYAEFYSRSDQRLENDYFGTDMTPVGGKEQTRYYNPQKITLWSAKADYTQPMWKGSKLEIGAKSSQSKTDNNLIYEKNMSQSSDQSNHFIYTEQVHALYASISQSTGKWSFQAGLRAEYTDSNGEQRTTGEVNRSTYTDLFPTAYINYSISPKKQLNLSYGRRIIRPNYNQLNPFEVIIDAYSFTSGNPSLRPMIMDNFSLSFMSQSGLMLRIAHNIMNDIITETPVQNGDRYGLKYNNFGKRTSTVAMVNYRFKVTKWWMANAMVQAAYFTNKSMESYGEFTNNGFALDAMLYNNFTITPTLSAELSALYTSAQKQGYYSSKPMGNVSVGLRQMLFKNKASISLNANDIFGTFKTDLTAQNGTMDYNVKTRGDTRWVSLNLRFSFGSDKVKAPRNRTGGIEDEKQRTR